METKDLEGKSIGPGTAGIAQRIPSTEEYEIGEDEYKLSILKYNRVMPCGQNQF